MPKQGEVNRPVHVVRYGSVKCSIWRNETKTGPMWNMTFVRSYKEGEQWHDSSSFGYDDLLVLSKAANEAHTYVHEQLVKRSESGKRNGGQGSESPG